MSAQYIPRHLRQKGVNKDGGKANKGRIGTPQARCKDKSFVGTNILPDVPEPILLTDEQVQQFLVQGYLIVQPNLPKSFHDTLYEETGKVFEVRSGNPGNNILPALPMLNQVYEDPVVKGALQSLVGKNYEMHPHRHCHNPSPGFNSQRWHRDSYWGYRRPIRYNSLRYVMGMYYPQAVNKSNGPTGLKPCTQYFSLDPKYYKGKLPNAYSKSKADQDLLVTVPAGSVVFIHFDIIHRGSANISTSTRYMFKFEFMRMEEPTEPTWNTKSDKWTYTPKLYRERMVAPAAYYLWLWLRGSCRNCPTSTLTDAKKNELLEALSGPVEAERYHASYSLGLREESSELLSLLTSKDLEMRICATMGLMAHPRPSLIMKELLNLLLKPVARIHVIYILTEYGKEAISALPRLIKLSKHGDPVTRLYITEAMGIIASTEKTAENVTAPLMERLVDTDDQIRFTAALSLARIGPWIPDSCAKGLCERLMDSNRYVQAYAMMALRRMKSEKAMALLLQYLEVSRWCPITNSKSTF